MKAGTPNQNTDVSLLEQLKALNVDVSGLENAEGGTVSLTSDDLTKMGLHVSFGPDGLVLTKAKDGAAPPATPPPEDEDPEKKKKIPPEEPPKKPEEEKPDAMSLLAQMVVNERQKFTELESKVKAMDDAAAPPPATPAPTAPPAPPDVADPQSQEGTPAPAAAPAPGAPPASAPGAPPPAQPPTTAQFSMTSRKHEDFTNEELEKHVPGTGALALCIHRNNGVGPGGMSVEGGMKFQDFTVGSADVDASGVQKQISKDIWVALEPKLVGRQLLQEDSALVGSAGHTKSYRKAAAMGDAKDFSEGADVPGADGLDGTSTPPNPQEVFSYVDCKPTKFGIAEIVYEDSIDEFDINIIKHTQESMARSMARRDDARIWNELLDATVETQTSLTAGDASSTRFYIRNTATTEQDLILEVTEVRLATVAQVIGTDYWVDYFRGIIEFKTPPGGAVAVDWTGKYSGRTNSIEASNTRHLSYDDIVDATVIVEGTSYAECDTAVFHTNQIGDIRKDEQFTHKSKYGSDVVLKKGEVGEIAGCNVLQSQKMYDGTGVVMRKGGDTGYYTWKKKLRAVVEDIEKKAGDVRIKIWQKASPCVVNGQFICVLYNMHRYSRALTSGTPI